MINKPPSESLTWYENLAQGKLGNLKRPEHYNHLPRRKGVLITKARTGRWTQCNHHLTQIAERTDPKCTECGVRDTTNHVINQCRLHEKERSNLLKEFAYAQQASHLLTSQDKNTTNKVTDFLVQIEDTRIRIAKEAEETIKQE